MIAFLTSSPTRELTTEYPDPCLDERNGFVVQLRALWRGGRCLMIAAYPDAHAQNDEMTDYYRAAVEHSGLEVEQFDLWDDRTPSLSAGELHRYDAVFLAGGHIATQNRWFHHIGLREKLAGFEGLLIGTSAGSMNSAREVYAWPEEPGEPGLPMEELFLPGLGLAQTVILPHYQKMKDAVVDGRHLMEDVTCSHSFGRRFYAVPDGSYVLVRGGRETLFGEAWLVSGGKIAPLSREGEHRMLQGTEE